MATFTININEQLFFVESVFITETDCASVYEYVVTAATNDEIVITLSGDYSEKMYILNGVEASFIDTVTLNFDTSLIIRFTLLNSNLSGYFNNAYLLVQNNDTISTINEYDFNVTRENDNPLCGAKSLPLTYKKVSTDTTVTIDDYTIDVDTANTTITLLSLSLSGNKIFNICNSSGGNITIVTTSSEDIYMPGGKVTSVILSHGEVLTVQATTSYWRSL